MKLQKRFLAGMAALTLIFSVNSIKVSAASNVVDFENGDYSFISMMTDDGSDPSVLSVVDLNGSKALKVDVQEGGIPKVQIDVAALVDGESLSAIKTLEFDFVIENPDGEVPNWNGGAIGSNGGEDAAVWSQSDWTVEEYNNATSAVNAMTRTFKDGEGFVNNTAATYLIMKWANNNDMYIDNIKFLDADGNPVPLSLKGADAIVSEEATLEETTDNTTDNTTEEVATSDAASTSEVSESLPQTGTAPVGIYFLVGGALIACGFVIKKRNTKEA